ATASPLPPRRPESLVVPYAVRELAFKNVMPRHLYDMVEDQLCDPVAYLEIDRLLLEVPNPDEQLAPIARVDHSLIDQQAPLAESARPAGDAAPQDFWHGDIDVGVYVNEGPGRDHRRPAHVQVPPSIARVCSRRVTRLSLRRVLLDVGAAAILHSATPSRSTTFQAGPPVPINGTDTRHRRS